MTIALLLAAVLAGTPDGGTPDGGVPWSSPIYADCPTTAAEATVGRIDEDGGVVWYMPNERAARVACLLESCESHRKALETKNDNAFLSERSKLILAFTAGAVVATGLAVGVVALRDATQRPR